MPIPSYDRVVCAIVLVYALGGFSGRFSKTDTVDPFRGGVLDQLSFFLAQYVSRIRYILFRRTRGVHGPEGETRPVAFCKILLPKMVYRN